MKDHQIIYRDAVGQEIRLIVPWGTHSGRIPPPEIIFYIDRMPQVFVYQGSA